MRTETIAQKVSDFALSQTYDKLPPEIAQKTKRFILDNIGCMLGGRTEESSAKIVDVVKQMGGNPQCTVIGNGFKTSVTNAALANGTIGHALELDDDHRLGTQHPGVIVIPTALAVGEYVGASGKELISAVTAGCEVTIRAGEAFLGTAYERGFHPTGTCGVFGSAVAAGKLLKLNQAQMVNALGIAGSQSSGLREGRARGAMTKRFQAGHANFGGTLGALMAERGFTGPATIFEGPSGFFRAYSYELKFDPDVMTNNLGTKYEMADTSIKPHACCRFAQPIVDCTLALTRKYDLKPKDIKAVKVGTNRTSLIALTVPSERKYRPQTGVDAQFSLPFAVAISIHHRVALAEEFTEKYFKDAEVLKTADLVTSFMDQKCEAKWPDAYSAVVTIETVDGRTLVETIDFPKGDPENPVTDSELEEKFKYLAKRTLAPEKIACVISTVKTLDQLDNVKKLMEMLAG